ILSRDPFNWTYAGTLGFLYEYGVGTTINQQKAFECYEITKENGDIFGQVSLGNCYLDGRGVAVNAQEALHWYRKSAELDRDLARAFEWYRKAALAGDCQGQFAVANFYLFGTGITQDFRKGFYWAHKGASSITASSSSNSSNHGGNNSSNNSSNSNNNSTAACIGQFTLALCYSRRWGTNTDIHAAILYNYRAHKNGDNEAIVELVRLFEHNNIIL
ncbi:894_t:CDS:2, partial [Ambispora leptoticha]